MKPVYFNRPMTGLRDNSYPGRQCQSRTTQV